MSSQSRATSARPGPHDTDASEDSRSGVRGTPVAPASAPAALGPAAAPVKPDQAAQPAPRAPRSRKVPLVIGIVLALVGGSVGAYAIATHGKESTDDAQIEADVVAIAPRIGGQVQKVLVHDNQPIKKGDLIVLLDDTELTARVEQAEAELATAEAQLDAARAQEQITAASAQGGLRSARANVSGSSVGVSSAEVQIAAAKAGLERARVDARKAEIDLSRTKELIKSGAISQGELDSAQANYDAAEAALRQAEAQLAAAQDQKRAAESHVVEAQGKLAQSTPIEAQLAAAHAEVELAVAKERGAEAALALAKLEKSYTTVTAPEDGVVSKLVAREGQLVNASQPIAELVPNRTYVIANFKETQIGRMRPGDRVEVAVDAFPGTHLEGHIESLSGGTGARFSLLPPDNASGNFVKVVQRVPVRIAWDHPPEVPLRAGLSADVTAFVGSGGK